MVILNKIDLVQSENVMVIKEWINSHLNRVRIIEAVHCDVPLVIILDVGRFDPKNVVKLHGDSASRDARPDHDQVFFGHTFDTWSFESERPFSLEALREMVRKKLPASIYRCKGLVFAIEVPDKRIALQTVGRRTPIGEHDDWGDRSPGSQIVDSYWCAW